MKRMLSLIALAAMASIAGPLKVGGDASGALFIPSFDPSAGTSAQIGFGGKVAPSVEYAINDQFSVRGNVGYEYATYGDKETDPFDGSSRTVDITSQFLTIDVVAQYAFIPQAFGAVGVGYDINLSTKSKVAGQSATVPGKQNPFLVEANLGYKVTPEISIVAGYRFPITPIVKNTVDNGDGTSTTFKLNLQTVTLGARYDFGL